MIFTCWYLWNVQIHGRWFTYWYLWNVVSGFYAHYKSILNVDSWTVICFNDKVWCLCAHCVKFFSQVWQYLKIFLVWSMNSCDGMSYSNGNKSFSSFKKLSTYSSRKILFIFGKYVFWTALLKFTACTNGSKYFFVAHFLTQQKSNSYHNDPMFSSILVLLVLLFKFWYCWMNLS